MVSKKLLPLAFIIIIVYPAQAQRLRGQARIDSLTAELTKATTDTHKIFLMSQLSFDYSTRNPEQGIEYGTQALKLAQKTGWEKGIADARYYRGANFIYTARYPEAAEDYLKALAYYEQVSDSNKMAGAYSNIGGVYNYQGKNDLALSYYLKALVINRKISPNSNFEVANLGNISIIYYDRKDYNKALEYSLQALNISEKYNFHDMLPNSLIGTGTIYLELNDYAKALYYSKRAMEVAGQTNNDNVTGNCYIIIGNTWMRLATDVNTHILDSLCSGNKKQALLNARINIDSAVAINNRLGNIDQLAEAYKSMSELEEHENNFKVSLEYYKLYKDLSDTIFNEDNKEKIIQASMEFDFQKKEAATKAEQEKKDIRQRNIRNSIMAGLVGALVFGIVVYRQRNKIRAGKKLSDELLLNILPEEVAEELKAKGSADAKQFEEVTVMFTDFKGFTQISEKLSPAELVAEIHTCFKAFDNIISKYKIEKIKTIGDSYMCAGGLPVTSKTHATDVVNAALEIQQYMQQHINERKNQNRQIFELRIGVHTGTVVAGIVGVKKFAYDIWGDTVNIASRMESSGEAGKVNISGSTYALVKDNFSCTYRGKINAKNKGEVDMYFVGFKNEGN